MISASSSSTTTQVKYDVFISFRGADTRNNIISHLYEAFLRKDLEPFRDDVALRKGDEISTSLLDAIQESKASVVIFSKEYASSSWCLEQLVKIMECKRRYNQIVIPVFYNIEPTDVRHQTATFAASLVEHEEIWKRSEDEMQRWKSALTEAAGLSGFDSAVITDEYVLIVEVVNEVLKRLNLVGMDSRVEKVEMLLRSGNVGIWGPGGMGKTTLAEAVLNKISDQFDVSYHVKNVAERSERVGGLDAMREELLSGIYYGEKVLVVLDDLSDFTQKDDLLGNLVFNSKSRYIFTTRNKQILGTIGAQIYEVEGLADDEALKLISRYAFKQDYPKYDYVDLSYKVTTYAQGLPLALKLLGSSLFGKDKDVWESTLDKLKRVPFDGIQEVLKISFQGLDKDEQNILLDIACLSDLSDIAFARKFLNACGFHPTAGLSSLADKCLITMSSDQITMHDLVRDMGRTIAQRTGSRLWRDADILEALANDKVSSAIECICLDMRRIPSTHLNPQTFTKLDELRFFKFHAAGEPWDGNVKVDFLLDLDFHSTKLTYFNWEGYPMKSLPSKFRPENLVELRMYCSKAEQLWEGVKTLVNLELIDLSQSYDLKRIPDLSHATNLKYLYLHHCESLVEIPSSIQHINKLVELDLQGCISLETVPSLIHLKSLSTLHLNECSKLKMFPEIPIDLVMLICTTTTSLPNSICGIKYLKNLYLYKCYELKRLPNEIGNLEALETLDVSYSAITAVPPSVCEMKSLQYLTLSSCSMLEKLPDEIGNLKALKYLYAAFSAISAVPPSIAQLDNLETLSFRDCKISSLPPLSGLCSLDSLDLTNCGLIELPDDLGQLSKLQHLQLGSNNFEMLPKSITNLSELSYLELTNCERLRFLTKLSLYGESLSWPSNILEYRFINCFQLDRRVLWDIMEDTRLKIQLAEHDKGYLKDGVVICYPGSEIPEWFDVQLTEHQISLELEQHGKSKNLVGFAVSMVVELEYDKRVDLDTELMEMDDEFAVKMDYVFTSEVGLVLAGGKFYPSYFESAASSSHVFVGFRLLQPDSLYKEAVFKFSVVSDGYQFHVKKCGAHLIYAPDSIPESIGEPSGSFMTDDSQPK